MKMENPLEPAGRTALRASREMLALEPAEKAQALRLMAAGVRSAAEKIVRENGLDMEEARKGGRNAAFLDRLLLTPERVEHMARGMEQVAVLPDPDSIFFKRRTSMTPVEYRLLARRGKDDPSQE